MTKEQYKKLEIKIGNKLCPICRSNITSFLYDRTDIFNTDSYPMLEGYEQVNIPNVEYYDIECRNCGFVITFNIKKLLR